MNCALKRVVHPVAGEPTKLWSRSHISTVPAEPKMRSTGGTIRSFVSERGSRIGTIESRFGTPRSPMAIGANGSPWVPAFPSCWGREKVDGLKGKGEGGKLLAKSIWTVCQPKSLLLYYEQMLCKIAHSSLVIRRQGHWITPLIGAVRP